MLDDKDMAFWVYMFTHWEKMGDTGDTEVEERAKTELCDMHGARGREPQDYQFCMRDARRKSIDNIDQEE
jgi:hypothetical protein